MNKQILNKILRFKANHYSFRQIGKKLGYSSQYIHQVYTKYIKSGGEIPSFELTGLDFAFLKRQAEKNNISMNDFLKRLIKSYREK